MTPLLAQIACPSDIKNLSMKDKQKLCDELRERILDVLSRKGGHLGSNLGIVELSVALHAEFNSPTDLMIFDTSHQTYPHKILTGRNDRFESIRQFRGLCGFAHPEESPHDHFYAGHAGTALSLALGAAKKRDLQKETHHVIAILGDASLTCGLTLEALNNIPSNLSNFIIILNDNQMSISESVGAMTQILNRVPGEEKKQDETLTDCSSLTSSKILEDGPTAKAFFRQFGLEYFGVVDGHNVEALIDALQECKNSSHPILLHARSVKGKGLKSAENNPTTWHGCRPFDRNSEKFVAAAPLKRTFPQVFGSYLCQLAETDHAIAVVSPAMLAGSSLTEFSKRFPERCMDVGIAEGHAVTYSGALSSGEKIKTVCSIYATFFQRAFDNLFQDVCLQGSPVVFGVDRAGLSGPDGTTHHGIYDLAFLCSMPGMVVCQPRNGNVLKELILSSFSYHLPTAIRYPNVPCDENDDLLLKRQLGKGEILQEGTEVLMIALGTMCQLALDTQKILNDHNIQATILDPIFIKPLDEELISSQIGQHKLLVVIEEHSSHGGLGSAIFQLMARKGLSCNVIHLAIPDRFIEHGSISDLHRHLGFDASVLSEKIIRFKEKSAKTPLEVLV